MKKCLVTGGAGFIGSAVAKRLIQLKNEVVVIDNLSTGYKSNIPLEARFIQGDCSEQNTLELLGDESFDAIFHIAGQSSGEISFEDPVYDIHSNTVSTLRLLEYARKVNCERFIYASTMSVYGENEKERCSEKDAQNPKSFYAIGKRASEDYLKIYQSTYGINFTALRYFNVYGPGQNLENMKQGMASIFLRQLLDTSYSEVLVKGDKRRFRDFVFIDDIVKVTVKTWTDNIFLNESVNVGTGIKTTIESLIHELQLATKIFKPVRYEGTTLGDQFGIFADNGRLSAHYLEKMTSLKEGIQIFVNSLK